MPKFICSIYENRPQVCKEYPWNDGNDIFEDCIFFNKEDKSLRSMEEQLKISTPEEISEYCVGCGKCFGVYRDQCVSCGKSKDTSDGKCERYGGESF